MQKQRPRIGIGVYIFNDNDEILIGERLGSHGEGTWCPPGGHLEFGETLEECAARESLEESGVKIKDICFAGLTNDIFTVENKHYVTVHLTARFAGGTVELKEPDKWIRWNWIKWENFPKNLFLPVANFRKQIGVLAAPGR